MNYSYIYINLEYHEKRMEHMENLLKKLQLPYKRFNAISPLLDDVKNNKKLNKRVIEYLKNKSTISRGLGIIGCYLSHYNVLLETCNYNNKYICILEDDLNFDHVTLLNIDKIISFLDKNYDWDMFRIIRDKFDLGIHCKEQKHIINNIPFYKFETPHYQSIYNNGKNNSINGGTYFQIINRKNVPKIINYLNREDLYNIDSIYSTNQLNIFYSFNKNFNIEINLFDSIIPKNKLPHEK
jgi:GR25 family glycosyltransferase involved in LPS biosynthesis